MALASVVPIRNQLSDAPARKAKRAALVNACGVTNAAARGKALPFAARFARRFRSKNAHGSPPKDKKGAATEAPRPFPLPLIRDCAAGLGGAVSLRGNDVARVDCFVRVALAARQLFVVGDFLQ